MLFCITPLDMLRLEIDAIVDPNSQTLYWSHPTRIPGSHQLTLSPTRNAYTTSFLRLLANGLVGFSDHSYGSSAYSHAVGRAICLTQVSCSGSAMEFDCETTPFLTFEIEYSVL